MLANRNTFKLGYLLILFCEIFVSSCDHFVDSPNVILENLDCDKLRDGIINMESRTVKTEIDKLLIGLEPSKTASDNIGHKENIDLLIERMNTRCADINAELICYACIKTNPPQSEILVTTDSVDIVISRVIDILTPDDAALDFVRIHEYHKE